MKRGDVFTVVPPREFGKVRPAVVVQSDMVAQTDSSIFCPITSDLRDSPAFRLRLEPSVQSGLRLVSEVMVDKVLAVPSDKIRSHIGRLPPEVMEELDRRLAFVLGLGA